MAKKTKIMAKKTTDNSTPQEGPKTYNLEDIDYMLKSVDKQLSVDREIKSTDEQKQESNFNLDAESLNRAIKGDVYKKMEYYDVPPRFLKPAFFLDSLAPYLKVTLITNLGDASNPRNRMELFDSLNRKESTHNHLAKFTYESTPDSGEMATITITDADQGIIDQVMYLLASLQNGKLTNGNITGVIYIEVQFGWSPDAQGKNVRGEYADFGFELKRGSEKEFVRYTRTIYMVPGADDGNSGISVEYAADGNAKMIIKGSVDQTFPDPYKSLSPFSIFGPMPAVNLTLYNLDKTVFYFVKKLQFLSRDFKDITSKSFTTCLNTYYITMVEHFHLAPKIEILNNILISGLQFYCESLIDKSNDSFRDLIVYNFLSNDQTVSSGTGGKGYIPVSIDRISMCIKYLKKNLTQGFLDAMLKNKDSYFHSQARAIYKNFKFISDYRTISGTNGHQTFIRDGLGKFKDLNMELDSINISSKNYIYKLLLLYYQQIGMVAQELKLHPYFLYCYIMQGLSDQLSDNQERYKCDLIFLDYGALIDHTMSVQDDRTSGAIVAGETEIPDRYYTWDTSIVGTASYGEKAENGNVLPFCRSNYKEMKWDTLEAYYHPAHSFNTSFTEDWNNYLNKICNCIIVDYAARNATHARSLNVEDTEISKAEGRAKVSRGKNKNGTFKIPVKLRQQMFLTGQKDALENIKTQWRVVKGIIILLEKYDRESKKDKQFQERIAASNAYLNKLKNLENAVKSDANKKYIVCIRDVVATDMIFDADLTSTSILQAFSYRTTGIYDGQYDPGMKSCWTVNFPDVLEFTPNYNAFTAVMGITKNAHYIGDTIDVKQSPVQDEINTLGNSVKQFKDTVEGKAKRTDEEINLYRSQLESYKSQLKNHKTQSEITQKYGHKYQLGHYGDNVVLNDNETHAQSVLRSQQSLRRRTLLTSNSFDADLKTLGDPNFDLFSRGKNIFLKFINNDGMLGYFTGIYVINGFVHELEGDKFTTSFKLSYFPTVELGNKSLEKMINNSDVLSFKYKINPY